MATGDIYTRAAKFNPRGAAVFDGADDFVAVNAWGTDRQTANDTAGTISAWICQDALASYAILTAGDTDADEFIWFGVVNGLVHLEGSDGGVTQFDIEGDNIDVPINKWTHVAMTQNAIATQAPRLFVDGVRIDATADVSTDLSWWFDEISGVDKADIGILHANATVTEDMNGAINEVKHWDLELTEAEIMADFKDGIPGNGSTGLTPAAIVTRQALIVTQQVSRWKLQSDFTDSWAGANDGSATGAFIDTQFSEATSVLRALAPVVADDISISASGGVITAVVVRA